MEEILQSTARQKMHFTVRSLEIQQPRARDNDPDKGNRVRFTPSIVPQYMKKSPSMEELIPVLYLLGVSTGDMSEALSYTQFKTT